MVHTLYEVENFFSFKFFKIASLQVLRQLFASLHNVGGALTRGARKLALEAPSY